MALSINTNVAALNAYRNLNTTQNDLGKSLEKLSSGFRINRAADDAAGLAISEGMRSQIGGIKMGIRNAQDGISVVQTAEGALNETHSILQRMRDLSVQANNSGSLNDKATANIQSEIGQLTEELTRITSTTKFNGQSLLDGTYTGTFQVGANVSEKIEVALGQDMSANGLGLDKLDVTTKGTAAKAAVEAVEAVEGVEDDPTTEDIDETVVAVEAVEAQDAVEAVASGAEDAITAIETAIETVSTTRSDLGAFQNRFEHTINNLNVAVENLSASESRVRDADMAQETLAFSRSQILSQAGTAMLAQAKSIPQGVLQLLQ